MTILKVIFVSFFTCVLIISNAAYSQNIAPESPGKMRERTILLWNEGDVVAAYADTKKANDVLGWKAELSLENALLSAWNWERKIRA